MSVEDFLYSNPPDYLVFRLEDRRQIINDFYKRMENLFPWLTRYVEDVEHAREIGLESSVVSHLTYNLLLTLSKASKGLNTYEYIRSQYFLDDEYDKAYEIWLEFVEKTKKIKDLINSIDCHYFDDDVDIYEFVNSIIPPNLNNIEGFDIDLSKTDMERIELDSADLVGCIIRPIPVQFPEVLQGTSEA